MNKALRHLFVLLLLISTSAYADSICKLKVNFEIPEFVKSYPLKLEFHRTMIEIDNNSKTKCVTFEDAAIISGIFSRRLVKLNVMVNNEAVSLFTAMVHFKDNAIRLDHVSQAATLACGGYCGYYEYNKLMDQLSVKTAANKYIEALRGAPKTIMSEQSMNVLRSSIFSRLSQTYDNQIESEISLKSAPPHEISYGAFYTTGIWGEYSNRLSMYKNRVKVKLGFLFDELYAKSPDHYKATKTQAKPYEKAVFPAILANVPWQLKKKQVTAATQPMLSAPNDGVRQYANILIDTLGDTDRDFNQYTQKMRVGFDQLADNDMASEFVIAHLFRAAFHNYANADSMSTIFSLRFKRELLERTQEKTTRERIFEMNSIFSRFKITVAFHGADKKRFAKFVNEYKHAAVRTGDTITVNNIQEQFTIIFEQNAWRLDTFKTIQERI